MMLRTRSQDNLLTAPRFVVGAHNTLAQSSSFQLLVGSPVGGELKIQHSIRFADLRFQNLGYVLAGGDQIKMLL
jgi:hypothetical protein